MNYEVGDTIIVSMASWGCKDDRIVLVDEHEQDIKNGRPGFGGTVIEGPETGMTVWGYDTQVTGVRKDDAVYAPINPRQQTQVVNLLLQAKEYNGINSTEVTHALDAALAVLGAKE